MNKKLTFALAPLALSLSSILSVIPSHTSHAALITETISFEFNFGPSATLDPVSGSFTITFDPAADVSGEMVDSISFNQVSPLLPTNAIFFDFRSDQSSVGELQDELDVYFEERPVNFVRDADWLMQLAGITNDPFVPGAGTFLLLDSDAGGTLSNSVGTFSAEVQAVPLPASLWLVITAISTLFGVQFLRHRNTREQK